MNKNTIETEIRSCCICYKELSFGTSTRRDNLNIYICNSCSEIEETRKEDKLAPCIECDDYLAVISSPKDKAICGVCECKIEEGIVLAS